ncbi:hypothetical protein ACIQFZ_40755 [Streptomyces sp. NPDC093064]|uniref:hypothetical protein n=1 Tax=unclassified Streptomyces TaxID=2593676 RepID=UPI0035D83834
MLEQVQDAALGQLFGGSLALGALYDRSVTDLMIFSVVLQLAAVPVLLAVTADIGWADIRWWDGPPVKGVAADWERCHAAEGARERVPGVTRGVADLVAVSTMPVRRTLDACDGDPPGTCGTRRARR